jgi:hypothetical protein
LLCSIFMYPHGRDGRRCSFSLRSVQETGIEPLFDDQK